MTHNTSQLDPDTVAQIKRALIDADKSIIIAAGEYDRISKIYDVPVRVLRSIYSGQRHRGVEPAPATDILKG